MVKGDFCDIMLLWALGVGLLERVPWTKVDFELIAEAKVDGKSLRRKELVESSLLTTGRNGVSCARSDVFGSSLLRVCL
jgi:hypothetical protein